MKWSTRGAAALACVLVAGSSAADEHRVYRAHDTIRFERHCADAVAHRVQAWARIESEDSRAHALVLAYARHHPVRQDDIFIGLRLFALRVDAGKGAAQAHWSVRMEAHGTGSYVGAEHTSYDSNPAPGEGERRPFRADGRGVLKWLDSTEPGEEDDRGGYPHNWSPEMETTAAELALSDSGREVTLDLVLTQLEPAEAIRLLGPTLWVPDRIWHERPPKPKTLALLQALNPFEEGGIWQWFRRGAKYGRCIEERRAAKEAFATQIESSANAVEIAARKVGRMGGWRVGPRVQQEMFARAEYPERDQSAYYTRSVIITPEKRRDGR